MRSIFRHLFEQTVFFNLLFFGVMAYGLFVSIPALPIDRYPNISFGEVVVSTPWPGASADEVERQVTEELEEALRGMENIEFIRSSSMQGFSNINVKFEDDTDYDALYEELRLRMLSVQNRLPVSNGQPLSPNFTMTKVEDWLPVLQFNLIHADPKNPMSRRALGRIAEELQRKLESIDGMQEVKLNGRDEEQFTIALKASSLRTHGITFEQVRQALIQRGGSLPAGKLKTPDGELNVLLDDHFRSSGDVLDTVVRLDERGTPLRISELVDPKQTRLERMSGGVLNSVNGSDTVTIQLLKKDSANAKTIRDAGLAVVDQFLLNHKNLPIAINTSLDSTDKINDGLGVLQSSLTLSMLLVMLALFLFLSPASSRVMTIVSALAVVSLIVMIRFHEDSTVQLSLLALNGLLVFGFCRPAVLTVAGIAFSFVGCLILFQVFGYSLNEITLLGFVLTSGIIVDDAIVVLENIQRHREQGRSLVDAAVEGTAEVFWPVISASITTICAFLPMLIMSGSTGEFFALVPISVSAALVISLFECLLIMPVHSIDMERWKDAPWVHRSFAIIQKLFRRPTTPPPSSTPSDEQGEKPQEATALIQWCTRLYDRSLEFCLRKPGFSLLICLFLILAAAGVVVQSLKGPAMGMAPLLKLKFFPDDTSVVQVELRRPKGSTLEGTDDLTREISQHLMEKGPGFIRNVTANAGLTINSAYKPIFGDHLALLMVELPLRADRAFENPALFIDKLRQELDARFEVDGVNLEVRALKDGPPVGAPVHVRIVGVNQDNVVRLASDLHAEMSSGKPEYEGMVDLRSDRSHFTSTLVVKTRHDEVARLGLSSDQVRFHTATMIEGAYGGELRLLDEDEPIRLKLADEEGSHAWNDLPIMEEHNRLINFSDVASTEIVELPSSLERRDFQRIVNLTAGVAEGSLLQPRDFQNAVMSWYENRQEAYPGATVAFGGEAESTAKSYASLASAFFLSLFLIYAVLSVQFKSYTQPMLIMVNILFSLTGVVLMTGLLGFISMLLPEALIAPERSMITVQSFIAVVGLTGLVVNDAIVLIDFINKERDRGLSIDEAVRKGAHQRVRPILMTTWSTIAGLLPLAIGIPYFSITWGPFATCFVAGLSASTLMTLLIVPLLYHLLEQARRPA